MDGGGNDNEKKDRLLAALDAGLVMIHLDARRAGVTVPLHLRGESHLRLNLSYRFDPPDLSVGEWGIRATLSFGGKQSPVAVPWLALFAITSQVTKEFWMYPGDMPPELMQKAMDGEATASREGLESEAPELQVAAARPQLAEVPAAPASEVAGDESPPSPPPEGDKPRARPHLRLVK